MTSGKMKAFLAMIIAMGLVNQENIQDYWSTNGPGLLVYSFFSQITSRDKFINILKFFHLCDNDNYALRGQEVYSPVNKLDTMYSVVTWNFFRCLEARQKYLHRGGIIAFRGKVHFKVYNPDKSDKYGVKSYQLCDSSNGYHCRFEIYTCVNPEPPSTKGKNI